MVHAVQNHAAPAVGHFFFNLESEYVPPELWWLKGGDDEYHPVAVERTVEAIGLALENMQPGRVGIAAGVENRVAFNRRFVMRDGTAEMGFGGHPPSDVAYNEGPIDPALGVVSFTTESLRPVALLLHHTCHPSTATPSATSPPAGPALGPVAFGRCTETSAFPSLSMVAAGTCTTATT